MTNTKTPRWPKAAAGCLLMLFLGSMYAWSYFKVALGDAFPDWTQKQITLNFTIMMCVFCLGGLLAGRLRLAKQLQVLIAGILMFVGFLGVSLLPQGNPTAAIWLLYLFYGCLNGLGTGIAYNAVLSSVQPWFADRAGLISGGLLMCLGFGSLLLGNLASSLNSAIGLFATFRVFGIADLVVMGACAALIVPPKAPVGEQKPAQNTDDQSGRDYTTAEMIRRPTFWLYFCWNICLSAGGMLVINSASSIAVWCGAAATLGLLVSVFNALARLGVGTLMDRLSWKAVMFLVNGLMLFSGALMLLGTRYAVSALILTGMMLMGVCYGSGITISAVLIRRLYGGKHYATNFSVCNLCTFPAAILGPMIAAALQDSSDGYGSTFVMVIVISAIALVDNFFIRKP